MLEFFPSMEEFKITNQLVTLVKRVINHVDKVEAARPTKPEPDSAIVRKPIKLYQAYGKWTGKFMYERRNYSIGSHDTREQALEAAKLKCQEVMGDESPYIQLEGNVFITC